MAKEFQIILGGQLLINTPDMNLAIATINSYAAEKKPNDYPNTQVSIHFKMVTESTLHIFVNDDETEFLRLSCPDAKEFLSEYAKTNFERPKKITLE